MLRAWGNGACVFSHNRGVFRFLCHGMNSAGGSVAVLVGWRRRVVVLTFIGSLVPCPLGRGIM